MLVVDRIAGFDMTTERFPQKFNPILFFHLLRYSQLIFFTNYNHSIAEYPCYSNQTK